MDIKVTQTKTCACSRDVIGVNGTCAACVREGSEAFWKYIEGEITFAGFIRRLRASRKPVRRE